MRILKKLRRIPGPGMITGVADDDPSGIATYSQTGAQFGYGQLWMALYMFPLHAATQEACARIGAVNGKGLAAVVKEHYSKSVLYGIVMLVLISNTINIGADIGAMAEATHLLVPVNVMLLTLFFTALSLCLEIFISYKVYASFLKWLCMSLFAYPMTVVMVTQPWWLILKKTLIPHLEFSFDFMYILLGVLGTTISPYLFFWIASEENEEERARHMIKRDGTIHLSQRFMNNLRVDSLSGMFLTLFVAWSIIVVTATVLHGHGIRDIKTAADAAKALEPLVQSFPHAGYIAKLIFSVGIIGLGLLSIPVLAGSAAYAMSEAFSWHEGLNLKFKRAHGFYGVITVATLIGLGINFIGIDPIRLLVYTAVINGIAAVPLLYFIARIARNEKIMGRYKSGNVSNLFVWMAFFVMALASVSLLYSWLRTPLV